MKKILTNLLIVGALFFIFPCMVDAETFTDGENLFVLKERNVSCDIRGYNVVNTIDDNLILADHYLENFIKVDTKGKCVDITLDEILLSRKPHVFYNLNEVNNKYVINEETVYFYNSYYEKTTDTEIDNNKTYFTITNGFIDEEVSEPKKEELVNYYERKFVKHYDSLTIDNSLTYYKRVGDTIEIIKEETPNQNSIQYYYIEVDKGQKEEITDTIEVSEKFYNLIFDGSYNIIKNPETDEFFLLIFKYDYVLDDGTSYVDVYDQNGNKIFSDIKDLILTHNSLYFVKNNVTDQTENAPIWSFDVRKSVNLSDDPLATIDNITFIDEIGYDNYNSILYGYIYDEDADEEVDKYYDLRLYKFIDGENFSYDNNDSKDIVVKTSGDYSLLTSIKVDSIDLTVSDYDVKEGSTVLTLKSDYLKTLTSGTHTLKIEYSDGGYLETTFTVINNNIDGIFKLTFDANGGKFKDGNSTNLIEKWNFGMLLTQEQPTKDGFKFKGWYTEKEGGIPLAAEPDMKNITTVYAQWEENSATSSSPSESVPQTFDGVGNSMLISIISMVLIFGSVMYLRKQKNERA